MQLPLRKLNHHMSSSQEKPQLHNPSSNRKVSSESHQLNYTNKIAKETPKSSSMVTIV
jgi:hypothetical protein